MLRTFILAVALFFLVACESAPSATQIAVIGGKNFTLELALDSATRFQGLSDRKSIDENGGMLFVFENAEVSQFVMRKCYVPIDILFLDASGRIVKMHEMTVEPYDTPEEKLKRYSSEWPTQFAIELRGGTLKKLTLKNGDRIDLPARELIKRAK